MTPRHREIEELAQLLRILGDPTRLRILTALRAGEHNVGELCDALDMAQPNVSRHLRILRMAGLVDHRREGREVWYTLTEARLAGSARAVRSLLGDAAGVRVGPLVLGLAPKR